MVWKLNPADLLQLRGGGGEPFVHFMDRLIRAEAAAGGLVQAEIETQVRVNKRDGGVDTEVKKAIPHDKTGWFAVPTCWQFKAVDAGSIDDKIKKKKKNQLQEEINKWYAAELIKKGYGYRLCLLGDLSPEKLASWESKRQGWEAQFKKEAQALYSGAPDPGIIHWADLVAWAERFPALVARLRNWTQGGFHWEAWQANCRAVTKTYVPNPSWEGVRQQILQHAQLHGPSVGGEACLTIGGAAGVGKTRLVFETLSELPEAPGLVLYLADEQEARAAATAIATTPDQTAILVADECGPPTRHFLNENLRGHTKRIRMICLENTGERLASVTGQVWLTADSLTNTEAVLAANFPHVPEERRRQYARFTKGFVRFAADMCLHDPELAAGDMSRILESVERYVRNRLAEHLPVVSAIALFHKIGFKEDVSAELDVLCGLTGCSKQQITDAARAVRESPGFVVQAGRYWYVTPEIVTPVLLAEGWQRWVSADLGGFFKQLPEHLLQQLLDRVATHGAKEVRNQLGTFFRGWFSQLTGRDLADPAATSLAAALVEASPGEYLPRLRTVIEEAGPGELRKIEEHAVGAEWGPRRTLVWLLERLVSFPKFFEDCECCLFRLALEESEPQISNNATAIWANLFSVYLSGTAIPFDQRWPILQRRTESSIIQEAQLGFTGLAKALQRAAGHILGEPVVAGRLRPKDWQPTTRAEEKACYRSALTICAHHLNAGLGEEHHRLAFKVLGQSLYHLLYIGLAEDLSRMVAPQSITEDEARKLLQAVDRLLESEQTREHAQVNERYAAYIQSVREWSNLFRPTDFAGRLRDVCARPPWDQRFSQDISADTDETDNLASLIVQQPLLLAAHLDWLASPEAQSAERLGFALGRIDEAGSCVGIILEHAIAHKAAPLLRGYIRGMVYAERPPSKEFLALMTKLESACPELAVDVLRYAGDRFDALNRILRLVDSQIVSPQYLANLAAGLGRRALSVDEVNRLMPYFTRAAAIGDIETARAGLRFLGTYLMIESRHSPATSLTSTAMPSHAWQLVESVLPFLGHDWYFWTETLKKLAERDGDRAARLLAQALLAEDFGFRNEVERELSELAKTYPESVMNGFGSALLDAERGWLLQAAVCRDLVGRLPPETVLAWVRGHGMEGARALARHLPSPHLDDAGNAVVPQVLDAILREYDDDEVFVNFLGGVHSGVAWNSNGGDQFRQAAENTKKFLKDRNPRIREWAKHEIDYRLNLAEYEDREHEERFLPS